MTRRHPTMCVLGVWMPTHYIKVFKTPNKGAWLGIFQPNWQSYKIVISPAWNIGSILNFDRVIEPHSRLGGCLEQRCADADAQADASADGRGRKILFSCGRGRGRGRGHAPLKSWLRIKALIFFIFLNWSYSCNIWRKIANSWWNLSLSKDTPSSEG